MTDGFAYYRVSTSRQERGASLETQREAVRRHIEANGVTLRAELTDVQSGTRDDRPEYQRLLTLLTPGSTLFVWRLDRIGRKKSELFRFFEWTKQHRIGLVSVTQPEMSNELARDIMSVLAAYESQQIAERVLPNMANRAMEGRWVSRAPRWYIIGPDGHLAPADDYADAQRAFETFIATRDLTLTAQTFETRTKTMKRHLRNRAYLGEVIWAGVTVPNAHPAIVTNEIWEAANQILDDRLRGKRRERPDAALLTGYLYANGTGRRMYRQPDIRRGNHRYSTREDGLPLPRFSVRCDVADAWVVGQLMALSVNPSDHGALLRKIRERARDDPDRRARTRLMKQRASLEAERDGTARMLARQQIDPERWERMDRKQATDLARVDAEIAALAPVLDRSAAIALADLRCGLDERVRAAWEAGSVAALRVLLERYVKRVDVWTEPSEGKRGLARGYWKHHPPRFSIVWTDAMVEDEQQD